jgi:putative addiction module component (TIGR02574 family)
MMLPAGFNEHPDDNSKEARQFRYGRTVHRPDLVGLTCRFSRGGLMITPAAVGCKRMMASSCQVYNRGMTSRAQELLREALTLPLDERADVAAELLASLDDAEREQPEEVEAAWAAEIERRARRVLAGESAGIPWEDVRRRAEGELRRR